MMANGQVDEGYEPPGMTERPEAGTTLTEGYGTQAIEKSAERAGTAVAAAAKAEVESAYIMAIRNPRNEENARIGIMRTCRSPRFAEKAIYSKPVGKKPIEGPSIRMAEEILRHWGNVLVQKTALYEDPELRISKVTVRDLQSNLSYSFDITVPKTVERRSSAGRDVVGERLNSEGERVYIVRATEDETQNRENAMASKAIRNGGLRLIPQHIIDEALDTVRETAASKTAQDPEGEKRKVFDGFATLGIKPSQVEKYLGKPVEQMLPKDLLHLRAIYTSIREGEAKWADFTDDATTIKEPRRASEAGKSAGNGEQESPTAASPSPSPVPEPAGAAPSDPLPFGNGRKVTEKQAMRFHAIAGGKGVSDVSRKALLVAYGIASGSADDIPASVYEEVCACVAAGPGEVEAAITNLRNAGIE